MTEVREAVRSKISPLGKSDDKFLPGHGVTTGADDEAEVMCNHGY